jgi:hypothetical protein
VQVQVFLQSEVLHDVEVIEIDAGASHDQLRGECLSRLETVPTEEFFLFIEDDDEEHPFEKHECLPEGLRVHLHRLRIIEVTVRYAGRDVRRPFRPSATIGRVKNWSTHELGIAPSDASELMLQVSGTDNRPDPDVHIGALVTFPQHRLTFDLVPSPRING